MPHQPITITDYAARSTEAYLLINVWDIYSERAAAVEDLVPIEVRFLISVIKACTEANEILDKRIDFENYPGVFGYEHADCNGEDSLAYQLFDAVLNKEPVDEVVNFWIDENVSEYVKCGP